MKADPSPALSGRVASLHLHPSESGTPLQSVEAIEVVEGKGIRNEPRYFARLSRQTGEPSRRQVSLIEREQIAEHAVTLGLQTIAPGAVRANVETTGMNLVAMIGHEVEIGDAVLFLYEARDPCSQMDAICQGLRELMMDQKQGVMAEVRRGGAIRVGDKVALRGL